MKAIILCAGKSSRTEPLTSTRPKPLLPLLNTTLLNHTLEQLTDVVDTIYLIVGYRKEMIMQYVQDKKHITCIEQHEQRGTGHAVLMCKEYVKLDDSILIMNGDDVFFNEDIVRLAAHKHAILAAPTDTPERFGILTTQNITQGNDTHEIVTDIIEKPKKPPTDLANTGCYKTTGEIMTLLAKLKPSTRGEIELTDAILSLAKKEHLAVERASCWLPVTYPWSVLEANVSMLKKTVNKQDIAPEAEVHPSAVITGPVHIGKHTRILPGTVIEGPAWIGEKCIVGPQAYIRKDTILLDACTIRGEVVDSLIMQQTTAKHQCYIGHSVIGEQVNIAAGTITSDYRHDGKEHITLIHGNKVNSKRRKLGAFIADGVKTGVSTLLYPGRKIWPHTHTLPGEIVREDKQE